MGEFGVSIKPQFIELDAKVLPPPLVVFGEGTDTYGPKNGRWNLRGKKFFQPATINGYGLIYFPGGQGIRIDERGIDTFTKVCGQQFANYGLMLNPRTSPQWTVGNPMGDLERQIGEMIAKLENTNKIRPNLLIFILPVLATEPYATLKSICDTIFGIASQCMVLDKCFNSKGQLQYLGNIALKVNVKLGGANSVIDDPFFSKQPTMLIGCDASHPNPAQRRMIPPVPTFTALSGSYDRRCSRYTAVTSSQPSGQEIIDHFGPMAKELIKRFAQQNNRKPSSIIYFRDGVSESEFVNILATELDELKSESSI
jgi:eukaryotic translation initiation factor 2C